MACVQVLELTSAAGMGQGQEIVDTDTIDLMPTVFSSEMDLAMNANFSWRQKFTLFTSLTDFKLVDPTRAFNSVAHSLASYGACMAPGGVAVWHGNVAYFVFSLVVSDFSCTS